MITTHYHCRHTCSLMTEKTNNISLHQPSCLIEHKANSVNIVVVKFFTPHTTKVFYYYYFLNFIYEFYINNNNNNNNMKRHT